MKIGNWTNKGKIKPPDKFIACLLYTSDAADERSSVDLGGRRIIKKKKNKLTCSMQKADYNNTKNQ